MTKIHFGTVQKGRFIPDNVEEYALALAVNNNKRVTMTVGKPRTNRSTNQNRYYFGVVVRILSGELGYTPEEMHEALKAHYLADRSAKYLRVPKRTSDLTATEFEEYLSRIRMDASLMKFSSESIYIPLPNEVEYEY